MTQPFGDAFEQANEADVVEQQQELDDAGPIDPGQDVAPDEASEADALEQGATITSDDQEGYPHQSEQEHE